MVWIQKSYKIQKSFVNDNLNVNMNINIILKRWLFFTCISRVKLSFKLFKLNHLLKHRVNTVSVIQWRFITTISDTSCFIVKLSNVCSRDLYATPLRRQTLWQSTYKSIENNCVWTRLLYYAKASLWFLKWFEELKAFRVVAMKENDALNDAWNVQC